MRFHVSRYNRICNWLPRTSHVLIEFKIIIIPAVNRLMNLIVCLCIDPREHTVWDSEHVREAQNMCMDSMHESRIKFMMLFYDYGGNKVGHLMFWVLTHTHTHTPMGVCAFVQMIAGSRNTQQRRQAGLLLLLNIHCAAFFWIWAEAHTRDPAHDHT